MEKPLNDGFSCAFLWGAATSSHQIEGHNTQNDWSEWEDRGFVEGGVRSGIATDHLHRFKEDLKLAADLGLNSYRFSVEWSRIEPEQGKWDLDAIEWYSELITECERNGLMPMLTLHHFTLPRWVSEKGGFTWDEAPRHFALYVSRCIEAFGSRIPLWCTINEPMVLAMGSYIAKIMPPAEFSPQKASAACRGLLRCHVLAYDLIHAQVIERTGPWKDRPLQVGIAHNLLDFISDRPWHPLERVFTGVLRRFYNQSWLDAVTGKKQKFGIPGLVPTAPPVVEALGRKTVDFIGVNYYTKAYVQWRPRDASEGSSIDLPLGISFARRREAQSDLGWALHPRGFRRVLKFVARYALPIYVTENGIADHRDQLRSAYLLDHLREISRACEKGVDVRGYYHWSLLDNFEWIKGFAPRFGLYKVDYSTMERKRTASADFYNKIIQAHRDPQEPSKILAPDRRWLGG